MITSLFATPDLALDLGTATTRVAGGPGGIRRRPSMARETRALAGGVIVDRAAATELLRPLMRRTGLAPRRVLACAPSDASGDELEMLRSCIRQAGASNVIVVPEPLAAAVGSGIDIGCRYSKFIVDFGGGVTDCAVIRDSQVILAKAERVGCGDLCRAVEKFARESAGIQISEAEAERVLRKVGLTPSGDELCRGVERGELAVLSIEALHRELTPLINRIMAPIEAMLRELPAAFGAEVIEDGIFLTGGGALLPGMQEMVTARSAIATRVVADPLGAVISGALRMLPSAAALNLWKVWERSPVHFR